MVDVAVSTMLALIEKADQPPRHLIARGELMVRGSARLPDHGLVESNGRQVWQTRVGYT
jgi:hypothetical protein